jgi:protein-L-isoaspartate O-methyltransferase
VSRSGGLTEARLGWAVDLLDPQPGQRVLEIGCGAGLAVALLGDRLERGCVVAVDRSAAMVAAARRRNAAQVSAGKVVVLEGRLGEVNLGVEVFDAIFAFNVSDLLRVDCPELRNLPGLLKAGGRVVFCHQPPTRGKEGLLGQHQAESLRANGFMVLDVLTKDFGPVSAAAVLATPTKR